MSSTKIESLVERYLEYWSQYNIDGLMSMYHEDMKYHDVPSGDVIKYADLRRFLQNIFAIEKDQRLNLKDRIFVEGNSAFIYWQQSFTTAETNRKVQAKGVELIVFRDETIISVHEYYDYQVASPEDSPHITEDSHSVKLTKLGLDEKQIDKIANEITSYFEEHQAFLQPDLNLSSLSDNLGYTRNQVSYVINHALGRSFYDFVNGQRIQYVIQQMESTESKPSILEMAINAGFNSVSGFYSAFKKQTGVTPAQYLRSKSK